MQAGEHAAHTSMSPTGEIAPLSFPPAGPTSASGSLLPRQRPFQVWAAPVPVLRTHFLPAAGWTPTSELAVPHFPCRGVCHTRACTHTRTHSGRGEEKPGRPRAQHRQPAAGFLVGVLWRDTHQHIQPANASPSGPPAAAWGGSGQGRQRALFWGAPSLPQWMARPPPGQPCQSEAKQLRVQDR